LGLRVGNIYLLHFFKEKKKQDSGLFYHLVLCF